jgi:L-ascorbate metabolism protein UlaG (beta-lactamase superfamily)
MRRTVPRPVATLEQSLAGDELTFVGHSTTLLQLSGIGVLTDPVLGRWIGPLRRQVGRPAAELIDRTEVAVISHLHRDHLDLPSLRRLRRGTLLIVPRGVGSLAAKAGSTAVEELSVGEQVSVDGLTITAVPSVHDPRRDPWGPRAEPVGYLLESGRRRVYFPGDTDLFAEMWEFGELDLALLPVWGWGPSLGPGHMDPWRAALALRRLAPRLAVPIHWGTLYPPGLRRIKPKPLWDPPLRFAESAEELMPDVRVQVLAPGGSLSLDPDGGH